MMKAVLREVSAQELARRKRLGLDRWDEMWEGVLHMSPAPSNEHQRIVGELIAFLIPILKRTKRGTIRAAVNVFRRDDDYRIPDLTFVVAERESIIAAEGIRGGPDAVIEIRSPEDETYEKIPFYAELGVREVIVVDRDTKRAEIYRPAGPQYVALATDREGWLPSETLGVRFHTVAGKLSVEDSEEPATRAEM